ncbi:hypothetical protein [Variovorax sp. PBL-E5]|uniref:hypothetical protein n=1 Tax=Variovorax sp. PBL-E5 TaxID=434014 RepID=UPI001317535F|nr:hypothetical protein [Variovorax sp. PBL-E5]VTU40300.1 hypothetical protein E5CHR_05447 [Variovorax sp. PBL-E5]
MLGDAIVSSSGTFSAAAYQSTAAAMGKAAGIDYRYGPNPAAYGTTSNTGRTALGAPADQSYDPISLNNPSGIGGDRHCLPFPNGFCGTWQVGGPLVASPGDYSSNIMQTAFVADSPAQYGGVAGLQSISMASNTFAERPQPSWATYQGVYSATNDSGVNDFNLLNYRNAGLKTSDAVAVGHCYGRDTWCVTNLMVFQGGLIAAAGSNTAYNQGTAQLAAGKVPTAIAVTNSGEFALVTVWDTVNLKGQVAVIALAGLCNACTPDNPGAWYNNWGEWNGVYPGLPNLGNFAYMKVLGYVDLPTTMKAPTEISASTGVSVDSYNATTNTYWNLPLSSDSNRTSFYSGANSGGVARTGIAVVISKSEQQAAFIDLRPLFSYYREQYFNVAANPQSAFNSKIVNGRGPADNQWPYTFTAVPSQMPTVIKTISLAQRPSAVKVGLLSTTSRAWVATQDGQLHIYKLGNYLNATTAGTATDITDAGTTPVAVGRNPTSIAYVKKGGADHDLIVTSRGDRRIDWVRFANDFNSGIPRVPALSLSDASLVDPISAEDNENHGTESYVLSVADYGGRKISNYRYGPVIFRTNVTPGWNCQPPNGCPVSGSGPFEYGGSLSLPGGVFQVVTSNIP